MVPEIDRVTKKGTRKTGIVRIVSRRYHDHVLSNIVKGRRENILASGLRERFYSKQYLKKKILDLTSFGILRTG